MDSVTWGVLGMVWWVEPFESFAGAGEGVNVMPERVEGVRGDDVGLPTGTGVWTGLCTRVTSRMLAEVLAGGMMRGRRTGRGVLGIVVVELR